MKILYCNKYNFPFSGTEIYLFDLMNMMQEQGHEVALFSMRDPRGKPTAFDDYFVPHTDFKDANHSLLRRAGLAGHAIYSRDARRRLRGLIDEFRPDVAHVRNIYHHLSPSIFWELKRRGVPVLYHLNDFKLLCPSYNLTSKGKACERCGNGQFWRMVSEGCYHGGRASSAVLAAEAYLHRWLGTYPECVDRFLAPSEFVRSKLMENGWNGDRIEVLSHFQKVPEEAPSSPGENASILYFGRLSAEKGVEDLLHAMTQVPGVRLVIAGEGPERMSLETLARDLKLKNVEFVGHLQREDVELQIRKARFAVLPSHAYETLGKTILESYAQGRAVVASDLGSRREFVRHGETGLLYPVGNVEQLAGALRFLCAHPEKAEMMGVAGREFVRISHSPAVHYQAMIRVYKSLIASKQHPVSEIRGRRALSAPSGKGRLRIAFIGGRGVIGKYSGIEGYYEEVGQRLAAAGHEVTIYCRNRFTPPQKNHNGMRLVRLPAPRSKHFETFFHTLLSSIHALSQRYDIVHYHTLGPALFSFIPHLAGQKTAVTVQGLDWQRKKWGRFASAVLRFGDYAAIRFPDQTMVVSRTLRAYYRKRYAAHTRYVANGTVLREKRQTGGIREHGLESGKYILFLGRFSPEKNCHLLVEAFEQLDTTVKLVLAGGGLTLDPYARELRQHASNRILMLDYVSGDAFDELLTNAMLFVLPSDLEGLSLALLEAMGAGLCVLVSDIPENRELMEGAGFTFRSGDVADLKRMLELLLRTASLRTATGRAARKRIEEHYLWPSITKEIEDAYHEMLGMHPDEGSPAEHVRKAAA
ncbi:MAG TPA: glycosyltransferase family 4 protein [Terriglobales bacterium]|nr:glycosyltransferase family 4 protein [Terriglobales bacterium]